MALLVDAAVEADGSSAKSMTEKQEAKRIAFWLLPAEDDHLWLKKIIEQFSARCNAPLFDPHVTLQVITTESLPDPAALLEQICKNTRPFTLEFAGQPLWSPAYNQALTLPLRLSPELTGLASALHPQQLVPDNYTPHLSLLYAAIDEKIGSDLARELVLSRNAIHFDRISAISIGAQTLADEDVRNWKIIATAELQ